ncbi:sigma factor G inhibitor Gin [Alloiococcus sp. CFN-8]|uniref:sigma factor G inhibitor Gin n=1 Tax=Alloiococcus sp. CFN-8 TaxID=3416081 RepID=UPI003CFA2E57
MKKSCILCRKSKSDGIVINGKRICKSCEEKLISIKAGNDFYEYYKECIKRDILSLTLRNKMINCTSYS